MVYKSSRDEFSVKTKQILAKRSGLQCTICKALTMGPGSRLKDTVINIGVAAHISAAAPGGPRYNAKLTSKERSSISNAIWLCPTHSIIIDRDIEEWSISKLRKIKNNHEKYVKNNIGVPKFSANISDFISDDESPKVTIPKEYAFIQVNQLNSSYQDFISPILIDKDLSGDSEIGILMCGSGIEDYGSVDYETPWTVFVDPNWLRWLLTAKDSGYIISEDISPQQIYGQIPGWPDTFQELLMFIVETDTTFYWGRNSKGYLKLSSKS